VYVETVVDHVGDGEFRAVAGLVGPFAAEPHVARGYAGAVIEIMPFEPLKCPTLDAFAALGDHPDAPAEACDQAGQYLEHARRCR